MTPRLKTIAKMINENMPGYAAEIVKGYCNTDRKMAGTRLRWPGKGRTGNRIIVKKDGVVIFDHNGAETYRCNQEVMGWYMREMVHKENVACSMRVALDTIESIKNGGADDFLLYQRKLMREDEKEMVNE